MEKECAYWGGLYGKKQYLCSIIGNARGVLCVTMDSKEIQKLKLRFGIVGNADELNRAIDIAMQVALYLPV